MNSKPNRATLLGLVATCLALSMLLSIKPRVTIAQTETGAQRAAIPGGTAPTPAVLLELFTSEGCSTCLPADKLLADLDQTQSVSGVTVIALSEHVDYWNRLGWKDPFSSAEFSRRQAAYAQALGIGEFYTPQMIVDGRTEFVGSKRTKALEAIGGAAHSPKATVTIAIKTSAPDSITLAIQVENVPDVSTGDKAEVMIALAESGLLSKVSRGENSGRELAHSAVTRKLTRIGTIDGRSFSAQPTVRLDSAWNQQFTKVVVFLQERTSRRVLGVAALKLVSES
jgi:hypothetical protein